MVLVDTSIWIDWLRGRHSPQVRYLGRLLEEETVPLAAMVLQEILQGARGPEELAKLQAFFGHLTLWLPDADTFSGAAELYARCRWAGITPRSSHDCLIAQMAIERRAVLMQDDEDFRRIRQVEPRLRLI